MLVDDPELEIPILETNWLPNWRTDELSQVMNQIPILLIGKPGAPQVIFTWGYIYISIIIYPYSTY